MRLLCALGLLLALLHVTSCLLIGAFNIRTFGVTKSGIRESKTYKEKYEEAMKTITKIVQRYDIILIQEVLDSDKKEPVSNKLLDLVNKDIPINSPHHFTYISSDPLPLPLGGSNKERYLFLYKDQKVTVKDQEDSFQYDEGKEGVFRRPPFVVKFSSTQTAVEFVLIPIHTKPGNAVKELNALVDVVDAAKLKWTNNNIMVLGDFNADGPYLPKKKWPYIRLFTNKGFHWLINDKVKTTLAKSPKAYDRIVVSDDMKEGVVAGSAGIYNFKTNYSLTLPQALAVSNHFPVQVRLKLKPEVEVALKPSVNHKKRDRDDLSET